LPQDQYGIKATVVAFDNPNVHVLRFAEGKVAKIRIFEDSAQINAALEGYPK
jgi:ketosteroid isomerase-like protein